MKSSMSSLRSRLPWFTILRLVTIVAAVLVSVGMLIVVNPVRNPEYEWFEARYGPSRYSQYAEEWLVRDYFKDRRAGFFVDVGASDYKRFSNTYYLEQALGWSGLAIDAQGEFAEDYRQHRPRTRFFTFFVSDRPEASALIFVPDRNRLVASSNTDFAKRYEASGTERNVRTITLDTLLAQEVVSEIDFLTMDIELAEPRALAGFDIAYYRPHLVCIEAHPEVRQQLLDYFEARDYRLVGRYLRADPHNLWFAPADSEFPPGIDFDQRVRETTRLDTGPDSR